MTDDRELASGPGFLLAGGAEGFLGFGGEVHDDEIGRGVEIVLTRFVDYAQIAFLGGFLVGNDDVNLPLLQIVAVLVLDAQGKLLVGGWLSHGSIQKSLDLHLLAADAMGFVPMKLGPAEFPAPRFYRGDAFELSPSAGTELTAETHDIVDLASYGNHFDIGYLPYKLEIHARHPKERPCLQLPPAIVRCGRTLFNLIPPGSAPRAYSPSAAFEAGSTASGLFRSN